MTTPQALQKPPRIKLQAISAVDWDGNPLIPPEIAEFEPDSGVAEKVVGDIEFIVRVARKSVVSLGVWGKMKLRYICFADITSDPWLLVDCLSCLT